MHYRWYDYFIYWECESSFKLTSPQCVTILISLRIISNTIIIIVTYCVWQISVFSIMTIIDKVT